ncbi:RNA polymerase sigma factor [Alicyclobacillus sp. SO9]|uniref:RNA polymerase sigma factor n=1 Tax=Alicyclobacillus sp. SO9 TaxID=2665646 RepID=UPI0018E7E70F|nr:sigma-70 family RNA polymerase sigma factor [Alicyclobacillus sp. SO9]QQE78190.1 sigma-70 family RNA polymerase sigma factor [Alicyclobacillus sp. SO9]
MTLEQSTEELLKTYGTDVLRFIRFYTKSSNDAEDLTQEVFLRAHRNRSTFRNQCQPKTWLMQIAVNVCRNYYRTNKRHPQILVDRVPTTDWSPSAETEAIQRSTDQELVTLVLQLPITLREVIVLHYYEERPTAEIAKILGVTVSTVKVRLFRARKALKQGKECREHEERIQPRTVLNKA